MRASLVAALAAAVLLPTTAEACGGFFCNAATPVNQAAERILFAVDGDNTVMHVQVDYQGPPVDFGWIVPVPRGVETALSSEALFQGLDTAVGPRFQLNFEFDEGCAFPSPPNAGFDGDAGSGPDGGVDPGGVTVVSRENVGPYDRAILEAQNVAALRAWLDENQFAIPRDFDERLVPYIEAGAVFVVIKLLPGVDTGEIVPLKLSFPGTTPSVPIVPTAVAATPDLGVIVHVLGRNRAIPLNYRHVQINEATIDWNGGGQNYPDVVSQAADEAGGHAFTTDFAGPLEPLGFLLPVVPAEALTELDAVRDLRALDQHLCNFGFAYGFLSDLDANRIFTSSSAELREYFQTYGACSFEFAGVENQPVDGAALAAKVRTEINEVREDLNALFGRQTYLTRLYSTLSPVEMDRDPLFDFNPDLEDVANVRTATARVSCGEDGFPDTQNYELITSTGVQVQVREGANPMAIRRRDGMTVQQGAMPAAAVVERLSTSGPPEIIEAADLPTGGTGGTGGTDGTGGTGGTGGAGGGPGNFDAGTGGSGGGGGAGQVSSGDDDGCSTRPGAGGGALGLLLGAFGLTALGRRRRATLSARVTPPGP